MKATKGAHAHIFCSPLLFTLWLNTAALKKKQECALLAPRIIKRKDLTRGQLIGDLTVHWSTDYHFVLHACFWELLTNISRKWWGAYPCSRNDNLPSAIWAVADELSCYTDKGGYNQIPLGYLWRINAMSIIPPITLRLVIRFVERRFRKEIYAKTGAKVFVLEDTRDILVIWAGRLV